MVFGHSACVKYLPLEIKMKKCNAALSLLLLSLAGSGFAQSMSEKLDEINRNQNKMRRELGMKPVPVDPDKSPNTNSGAAPGNSANRGNATNTGNPNATGSAPANRAGNGAVAVKASPTTGIAKLGSFNVSLLGCERLTPSATDSVYCRFVAENTLATPQSLQLSDLVLTSAEQYVVHSVPLDLKSGVNVRANEKKSFSTASPNGFTARQVTSVTIVNQTNAVTFENIPIKQ
jgi:hypothetical protein